MIRLLVVENQPAIRRGLRMWLQLAPDVEVVGEADDSLSALWQLSMAHPDVVLIHLEPAEIDDGKLIRAMRSASPESAVVVLSLRDDGPTRRRSLGAGAAAFVSMHEYGERLLQAVRQAASRPRPESKVDQAPPTRKATEEL